MKVYVVGSLRNPRVPQVANELRRHGLDVFDDWFAAGEFADDAWKAYEQGRGRTFVEALKGLAAEHVFNFDLEHLDDADVVVVVAPAGKSAHTEMGYAIGSNKPVFVLMEEEPAKDRWDVMLRFATDFARNVDDLVCQISLHTNWLPATMGVA